MPAGKSCYICKHTKAHDPGVHMHRFPGNPERKQQWLQALNLLEKDLPREVRICSRHFPDGDTLKLPSLSLGKRFASPIKRPATIRLPLQPRKKQAKRSLSRSLSPSPSTQSLVTESGLTTSGEPTASISAPSTSEIDGNRREDLQVVVNTALTTRIDNYA